MPAGKRDLLSALNRCVARAAKAHIDADILV